MSYSITYAVCATTKKGIDTFIETKGKHNTEGLAYALFKWLVSKEYLARDQDLIVSKSYVFETIDLEDKRNGREIKVTIRTNCNSLMNILVHRIELFAKEENFVLVGW